MYLLYVCVEIKRFIGQYFWSYNNKECVINNFYDECKVEYSLLLLLIVKNKGVGI